MTVFKTFLKILYSCKFTIIVNTIILVSFGAINMTSDSITNAFTETEADLYIINNDKYEGITKDLIDYMKENSKIIELDNDEESINDALFYRQINYYIEIPENFREDFLNGKNPEIKIKSTKDYMASLSSLILERYLKTASIYQKTLETETEIIEKLHETLNEKIEVETTTKLNTDKINKTSSYFNFASYTLLASCLYVVCLIMSTFKSKNINKRTIISSMNYKKYSRIILLSNILYGITLWILYLLVAYIFLGNIIFTSHGLIFIINSLIFILCSMTLSLLIGNIVTKKESINGIVNVIALGSSFLCGAFVPTEFLPEFVMKIARILPTYWYIKTNDLVTKIETIDIANIKTITSNMIILLLFTLLFIIIMNKISKKKRIIE